MMPHEEDHKLKWDNNNHLKWGRLLKKEESQERGLLCNMEESQEKGLLCKMEESQDKGLQCKKESLKIVIISTS